MTQMEYFEAGRKDPPTYQIILYTEVCIQNATLFQKQNGYPWKGHCETDGQHPSSRISAHSFSQQYLLSVYFWYNGENLNTVCILDNIIDSILISWMR